MGKFLNICIGFCLLSISANAASRRIQIDCGQGVFRGTFTAEIDTANWRYTCTDLPKQSTYVEVETPGIKIVAGAEIYESKDDRLLNGGFANKVSFEPNSCDHIANDSATMGVNALFKRFWHPEFGGKFPVSLRDLAGNTSLLLLDVNPRPLSTLSISGTILSGNQSCSFSLAEQD